MHERLAAALLAAAALAGWSGQAAAQGPANRIYFSQVSGTLAENRRNPESIATACAGWLSTARATLDVCCHEIDNEEIIQAVLAAHRRGVKVRVITETDYLKDAGPVAFEAAGIPVVSENRSALMHHKFAVIDGAAVWTGSFNFTDNCAYKNNNNGLYLADAKLAANYAAWFAWFWEYGHRNRRAGIKGTPHPTVTLARGTRVDCRFTTFDQLDQTAQDEVAKAKRSIRFMAFSFTHDGICRAMLERARSGVSVQGVFEARNQAGSVLSRMQGQPGVEVYADGNRFNMHHKVIVIDEETVITGSFNFSVSAAKDNDENLLVIRNRKAAGQYLAEFAKVFAAAKARKGEP